MRLRDTIACWLATVVLVHGCQAAECAEGFDAVDGVCVQGCTGCTEGQFCDTRVLPNECSCPAGYNGEPCQFDGERGLVGDPDFKGLRDIDTDEPFWVGEGTAGVFDAPFSNLPEFAGVNGVGVIRGESLCAADALTQVVEMPAFEQTEEALVAEVVYQARNVPGLSVGFGRSWTRLRPTRSDPSDCAAPSAQNCEVAEELICLGAGAYGPPPMGGEVLVRIGATAPPLLCSDASEILIRRFWIRPAEPGECVNEETGSPIAFGDVVNGEANPAAGGWRFVTEGDVDAELAVGVGFDGTPGARISRSSGSNSPGAMITRVSVPLPSDDLASPAFRFWANGNFGESFGVHMGTWVGHDDPGRLVETLIGRGEGRERLYCLPPWTHGTVVDLSFALPRDAASGTPDSTELVVDEVEIVDSDCDMNPDLLDPSFVSDNDWFGTRLQSELQLVGPTANPVPAKTDDGTRSLELRNGADQGELSVEMHVWVPPSDDEGGPAISFVAASPTGTALVLRRGLGELIDDDVATQTTWEPYEACLPAAWTDRWYRFEVALPRNSSPSVRNVFLDDFALDTSPLCPR